MYKVLYKSVGLLYFIEGPSFHVFVALLSATENVKPCCRKFQG